MVPTKVPLLFGTMTLGEPGKNGVRIHDLQQCQEILDVFFEHGHKELDTARMYAEGTTEAYLSELDLKGASVDTKVYPVKPGDHAPSALRATFQTSLKELGVSKVRVLYLHAPDRSVPFEDTAREMNELYKQGLFEIFGLSNYAAWEVAEMVTICKANEWVQPKIYQAMYNAVTREIDAELVPCCRKFGLRIVIYNPLSGGLFAGKISAPHAEAPTGGRFDGSTAMGKMYRARYLKEGYFDALNHLKPIAEKHQLRLTEIALRWCQHHSVLTPQDGIILGASSAAQLKQNLEDCEKGPLPEEVLKALDDARLIVGPSVPTYWR
ncbi:Aldo/keto reductase [Epithele typhae]|uniref:Aldo/keto reductase n=1 Tax=Epithele typhae TaxID=378194 RepID=UPI0020083D1F|nr:Aldo/keto reductase [Epithele typhae]XP_047883897.1 Aldo/keto reductase [Epithele typhae]KAH9893900.1 Aldo/keto reductase [Epithele typhae]KAH9946174.1 Aldo/keto reductase [Epithele typhae]